MGFDPGSLASVQLDELLEDHSADLNAYLARRVCRRRPVTNKEGSVYRFETPIGMSADVQRSVKHAAGTPSPKGNVEMGTRGYKIDSYSWKEGIDHLAEQELAKIENALEDLSGVTSHMVLGALDRELANILLGNGTSGTFDDLTEKAATNPWDSSGATPTITDDIDDVVQLLRPGSRGLMAICGYDIALHMSKNDEVVNDSDKDHTDFQGVRSFLRSRGITQIHIDMGVEQNGEREATRAYTGIFDGVFYIGTADNLILPQMNDLTLDAFYDDDSRTNYFRAAGDWDIVTGYAAHGYYYSGLTA